MGNVTKSQQNNITSPNGNSLAVFVDGITGVMKVKDVIGNIQPLSDFVAGGGTSPFEYNANATGIQPVLGTNDASGCYSTIGGGCCNTASCYGATVGGGCCNTASYRGSTIGGGSYNTASNDFATVGGGYCNTASYRGSTIGGGRINTASGYEATVGGGYCNISSSTASTVGGGFQNTASGNKSSVLGGINNTASCNYATIGGGQCNIASNQLTTIGGGQFNIASFTHSTVGGGRFNVASNCYAIIGGGLCNTASGLNSAILGGRNNNICAFANAMIIGSNLCATQSCTTFTNCLSANNLTVGCAVSVGANKVLINSPFTNGGGLFAQTSNSTPITATTVESSLIDGGVGTLTVPANGFSVGDSFTGNMSGIMSAQNNNTIVIRVKSGSVILAQSDPLVLPAITNQVWNLTLDFTIRTLGGTGVASIVTLGQMHILKLASGTQEGFGFNTVNTTTFDTTISNTLSVTAQWSSNNANNSIYTDLFVLTKIF